MKTNSSLAAIRLITGSIIVTRTVYVSKKYVRLSAESTETENLKI